MADAADDAAPPGHQPTDEPALSGYGVRSHRTTAWFTDVGAACDTAVRMSGMDGAATAVFAPSQSRELVYATDSLAQQLDDLQFTLGEGPCLDAYATAVPQLCPRLDSGFPMNHWPAFCTEAADLGVQAVFAFPVLGPQRALGVLELYRRTRGEMEARQYESAAVCAAAIGQTLLSNWDMQLSMTLSAAAAIDTAASDAATPTPTDRFSRAGVYIAAGMVAVQLGVSADHGLDRLRAYCYACGRSINAVAADIIARRLSFRGLQDDSAGSEI